MCEELYGEFIYGDEVYCDDYHMDETWKRVLTFPDYWISNKGRLWSTRTNRFVNGTPTGRCGHIDVSFTYGNQRVHKYIHRMVAEAFIPNPNGFPYVRHLDDDPSNNDVENLAWGTQQDNMRDAIRNERFRYFDDNDRERAMQKRRVPIIAVRLSDNVRIRFDSLMDASRRLDINESCISGVLTGKRHHAKGWIFEREVMGCQS